VLGGDEVSCGGVGGYEIDSRFIFMGGGEMDDSREEDREVVVEEASSVALRRFMRERRRCWKFYLAG
jgi:hypothetical protein